MRILIILLIAVLIVSCKSTHIDKETESYIETPVPITNTKIEYRDRQIYDSIYVHDSIYTLIKGDTVYIYKERTQNKYSAEKDTVLKVDTVKVPITITKTVNKKEIQKEEVNVLYWWQKALIGVGAFSLVACIGIILIKIKKLI